MSAAQQSATPDQHPPDRPDERPRVLRELPKAHLHLHLDGALRPGTLTELAARAGIPAPLPDGYGSFAAFTGTITAAAACLRTEDEVARVLDEIVEDAAADGAVWLELSMWPGLFAGRLGPAESVVRTVLDAGHAAAVRHGTGFGLVLAANRDRGPAEAVEIARLAAEFAKEAPTPTDPAGIPRARVVGFGLDGDEAARPPAPFAEACATARAAGLPVLPHAGELLGADSVRTAVDTLGARRIFHGVRAVEDPALVARLAAEGIVLDVCPTSNVLLSVAPSLAAHPLPALLAAGVRCTVNADDPLLFGTSLLAEYELCRTELALTDPQLAALARTSLHASAAPPALVARAGQAIDKWLAAGPETS